VELHFQGRHNGYRRLYVNQEEIFAGHTGSSDGTAIENYLLIPPGEHTIRWEASSGEHSLD
jgi:hypothetical protein